MVKNLLKVLCFSALLLSGCKEDEWKNYTAEYKELIENDYFSQNRCMIIPLDGERFFYIPIFDVSE